MKYLFLFLSLFLLTPAFAAYTENVQDSCVPFFQEMVAVFHPIEYTCDFGYFLPANVTGCRPCPKNYKCPGGTFKFNENQPQGAVFNSDNIITENISNGCLLTMPNKMYANFEPNVINITYDYKDESGTKIQSSCIYGELIELPAVPSRQGYVFGGWKVKTNQ